LDESTIGSFSTFTGIKDTAIGKIDMIHRLPVAKIVYSINVIFQ